jgi:hypothetical integral membrane protein (TIGR02206 family)
MGFLSFDPVQSGTRFYLEPFGVYHWAAMAVIMALGFLLWLFREKLTEPKREAALLTIATITALVFETGFHIGQYLERPYYEYLRGLIPFELCAITLWLSVALCITKNKTIFEILYFWGLGAVASLLFANDDGAGPDRFHYYQYFGTHAYIVLTIVYFAIVHSYRITIKSFVKAMAILFPITIAMRFFDLRFAAPPYEFNYMFLLSPPDVQTPLDSFGHGWRYYFAFIGLCVGLMVLAYLPWPIARLTRERRDTHGDQK